MKILPVWFKKMFERTEETVALPNLSKYHNLLFTGNSGSGKTVSGCFSEIERAISKKENIYVFCREREYDFIKNRLLQSNYEVATISEDSNIFSSKISEFSCFSPNVIHHSIFYENKVNAFGTDHPQAQNQFSQRLLHLCRDAEESKTPTLIVVDGLDFYNLPEDFWSYYNSPNYSHLRFVFTAFSVYDILSYVRFRNSNYELLLTHGQVIHLGPTAPMCMNSLQQTYKIPYDSIESYLRAQTNKNLSGWYGFVFFPEFKTQHIEDNFLLYPTNYAWRKFHDKLL